MPVSELEKKPESRMRTTSTELKRPSGASFKAGKNLYRLQTRILKKKPGMSKPERDGGSLSLDNQLQHQFGTEEGQHQCCKSGQGQAHRGLAAPAELIVAP